MIIASIITKHGNPNKFIKNESLLGKNISSYYRNWDFKNYFTKTNIKKYGSRICLES